MRIVAGDLNNSQIRALLEHHVATARAETAPGSAHALDLETLKASNINFWAAWDGDALLAVGALKRFERPRRGQIYAYGSGQSMQRRGNGNPSPHRRSSSRIGDVSSKP
jgi:putative acetyltransferase